MRWALVTVVLLMITSCSEPVPKAPTFEQMIAGAYDNLIDSSTLHLDADMTASYMREKDGLTVTSEGKWEIDKRGEKIHVVVSGEAGPRDVWFTMYDQAIGTTLAPAPTSDVGICFFKPDRNFVCEGQ